MKTKVVKVGNILIGGDNPIRVQSMITSDASYPDICIKKINELEKWGCEIVRLSVLNMEGAKNISKIKAATNIPLVADIHFDYKLAIECAKQGIDKIRINPGNIGDKKKAKEIVEKGLSLPFNDSELIADEDEMRILKKLLSSL